MSYLNIGMSITPAFQAGSKKGRQDSWQPYLLFGVPKGIPFGFAQDKYTPVIPLDKRGVQVIDPSALQQKRPSVLLTAISFKWRPQSVTE